MQSLSHQDSENVFGENFLFQATLIFYFALYPTIFHAKKFQHGISFFKKRGFLTGFILPVSRLHLLYLS